MAFRQEEITWFQSTIDEMARRIEDVNTSKVFEVRKYSGIIFIVLVCLLFAVPVPLALAAKK